jgi:hypothetical protein
MPKSSEEAPTRHTNPTPRVVWAVLAKNLFIKVSPFTGRTQREA